MQGNFCFWILFFIFVCFGLFGLVLEGSVLFIYLFLFSFFIFFYFIYLFFSAVLVGGGAKFLFWICFSLYHCLFGFVRFGYGGERFFFLLFFVLVVGASHVYHCCPWLCIW